MILKRWPLLFFFTGTKFTKYLFNSPQRLINIFRRMLCTEINSPSFRCKTNAVLQQTNDKPIISFHVQSNQTFTKIMNRPGKSEL